MNTSTSKQFRQTKKTLISLQKLSLVAGFFVASCLSNMQAHAENRQEIKLTSGLATPVLTANKTQNAYLKVALTGFELESSEKRAPLNVAIVLDQSSSMSGAKIQQAKQAARMAIAQLDSDDIISIVTYDSTVNVLVPATKAGNKWEINRQINQIRASGSTALFAGTSKGGYEVRKFINKERVNRVVLLSDGMANIGPSSPSELGQLGYALAKDGISVSTIGLGLGYNEDLMAQLADYSDGNHNFVENSTDLSRIFEQEFGQAKSVVAQDVNINILLDDGVIPVRIIGRDGEIYKNKISTRINQLYSQQESYVIVEVKVPAGEAGKKQNIAKVSVAYDHMLKNKRLDLKDNVAVAFSESAAEVKQAVDTDAYQSAARQVVNEERKQALVLRDQGKKAEARQRLAKSSSFLQSAADYISSDSLREESISVEEEATTVGSASPQEWRKKRKELKEKSYKIEKQQRQ